MSIFTEQTTPVITTMIQAKTPQRVLELIERGNKGGTHAFGIQMEVLPEEYKTRQWVKTYFEAMDGKPCYLTNYRHTYNEGKTDEQLVAESLRYAEYGAQLIDIIGDSFDESENQITYSPKAQDKIRQIGEQIHALGKEMLISTHTHKPLNVEQTLQIANAQKTMGADVCKIVNRANDSNELREAYRISLELSRKLGRSFLFLCGGDACASHRRVAPFMVGGMFLCVVEHDELSTWAQPLLEDAVKICALINRNEG